MDSAFLSRIRIIIIAFCVFFAYAVILIRLWAVQVYKGEEIQEKVSRQYVRNIRIPASLNAEVHFNFISRFPCGTVRREVRSLRAGWLPRDCRSRHNRV